MNPPRARGLFLASTVVLLAALCAGARGDIVHLENGNTLEGRVVETETGYEIHTRYGRITLAKSRVASIERAPTVEERYAELRATLDLDRADDLVVLGNWCAENDWVSEARRAFEAALDIDPDHEGARRGLGHELVNGRWRDMRLLERAAEKAAGALAAAEAAEQRQQRRLQRQIDSWFRALAYGSQKRCDAAYEEVTAYARQTNNPALAAHATRVKERFDAYWTKMRALATVEVRATHSSLDRPIRNFTTGLGTGSPVTRQLPSLGVTSVRTTVTIPAGRGK